jgi:gliding motility-associated-like protein
MNIKKEMRFLSFFIMLTLIKVNISFTQCSSTISTFPYSEGFETSPSWISGGTASDWAWGTPSHPLISTAGSGNNAWNVGGLNGSSYNGNQQSFIESQCFDFSNLSSPWISFKLFWEVEYMWDGATFQYSTDQGMTWINVGAYGDVEDCFNDNWFNYSNVNWLTNANPKHGWTGRVGGTVGSCSGGNGSAQWLEAKHCLNNLAGNSSVKFRFLFGSGNSCNSYDGFAIDDILIDNAPSNDVDFTYQCTGTNQISFTSLTDNCVNNFNWNFNDPNSSNNTSNDDNPIHIFSEGGNFNVILKTIGSCNQETTINKTIRLVPSLVNKTDISCKGLNNGSATAIGLATSTYLWNTIPSQTTATISSLSPGNYTVIVSDPSACSISETINISEPNELYLNTSVIPTCVNSCNGSLALNASGGTAPYTYSWNSLSGGQFISGNVCEGLYTGLVSDFNGCETTATVNLGTFPLPLIKVDSANICIGSFATLNASGAYNYKWKPTIGLNTSIGSTVTANPTSTTEYVVIGISEEGCIDSSITIVKVSDVYAPIANFNFSPINPTIYDNEVSFLNLSEETTKYEWNFYDQFISSEKNPTYIFPNNESGTYLICLEAKNDVNCIDEKCQTIRIEGVNSVYIPNTFSPNGDEYNNIFRPIIRDISPENYEFNIYNRWGELIFNTINRSEAWDGTHQNKSCPNGTYSWTLIYTENNGNRKFLKGSVLLKR